MSVVISNKEGQKADEEELKRLLREVESLSEETAEELLAEQVKSTKI